MVRTIALAVTSALVFGACSSTPVATTARPPVTTIAPTTTAVPTTTTTTEPPPTVRLYLSGVPEPLAELVKDLYIDAHTSSSPPLDLPPG
ncbi:MAG TPA: hypothetical protein ENG94_01640, partial [Actinobacteria bacterium]|nr:hypothetical protein [Actinomycetota bacterium]